jgi:hypothetical protein
MSMTSAVAARVPRAVLRRLSVAMVNVRKKRTL